MSQHNKGSVYMSVVEHVKFFQQLNVTWVVCLNYYKNFCIYGFVH